MSSHWSAAAVASIVEAGHPTSPLITSADLKPIIPGLDLWDMWPVQTRDSDVAKIAGGALFMVLSAPASPDPDDRHAVARIRLLHRAGDEWRDLGPALPDGHAPGSREWAGSAVLSDDGARVMLYFTAAGTRDEPTLTYGQRLFETESQLVVRDGVPALIDWTLPIESVEADGEFYQRDMTGGGAIGTIKAFRDPTWLRDPADGAEYLLFSASLARSSSPWNGAVGLARRDGDRWRALPPIIDADGVNNELERPHIVICNGRYHCFWSTQRKVFADGGLVGPTGLYGMVADRLTGPWRPINGSGLVFANPTSAPFQAYSWLVLSDLSVLSFVDMVGLDRPPHNMAEARARFGGVPAPILRLRLDKDRAWLA
jgi:levansucrase